MRKVLLPIFLLVSALASATVSIVQDSGTKSCAAGTTCTQTNIVGSNITAGNLVIFMQGQTSASSNNTVTAVSGGSDNFVHCSQCRASANGVESDIWYVIGSAGGYRSITITNSSGSVASSVALMEIAASGAGTFTIDDNENAAYGTATTTPTATNFTLTGSNDFLLQLAKGSGASTMTAITQSYTISVNSTTTLAYATKLNSITATGPQWTGTSVKYGLSSIAFAEHASGNKPRHKVTQN